ncbi:hypothetical protein ENUP19_0172G0017 [Entamoeba nuttalli]|uniref:Swi5-dependent recombination DNA repair protein 1 homolog n=2 Tax=Entamoeba nuttalli TaxID=412467 RepID=K2GF04_ENTNP|nr:hypothetical protein ENU1_065310 [Entamoeba nuttalli P19]EKE41171.1 hypothetical protein ENU1_065310 [Entamoeba nuttalli P19]|eukprot:XP_008856479.1 hypothetical protein ENU1_065310 [Entamoeba nuttalli P19]
MGEDALALKILESIGKANEIFFSEKDLQGFGKITNHRINEFKKSLQILEDAKVIQKITSHDEVYYIPPKEKKPSQGAMRKSTSSTKGRLRVSVTPSCKYKLNSQSTIDDLPKDINELKLLKVELICKYQKTQKQLKAMEAKAKSAKKCEGKNLDQLIKKWKTISRDLLVDIQHNEMCRNENGDQFSMGELIKRLDIDSRVIGFDPEADEFVDD